MLYIQLKYSCYEINHVPSIILYISTIYFAMWVIDMSLFSGKLEKNKKNKKSEKR